MSLVCEKIETPKSFHLQNPERPKKRALVLSGGSAQGAFQAGVLSEIDQEYDAVFGASAGALNAMLISTVTRQMIADTWMEIAERSEDFIRSRVLRKDGSINWVGGFIYLLLNWPVDAIYDNKGLEDELYDILMTRQPSTPCFIEVTLANGYTSRIIDLNKAATVEDQVNILLGSSALPAAFPPVEKFEMQDGTVYQNIIDGGLGSKSTLSYAVSYIKEQDDPDNWEIDIIKTDNSSIQPFGQSPKHAVGYAIRAIDILLNNNRSRDLALFFERNASRTWPAFDIRVIEPEGVLTSPLDFTRRALMASFFHGVEIAKNLNQEAND